MFHLISLMTSNGCISSALIEVDIASDDDDLAYA